MGLVSENTCVHCHICQNNCSFLTKYGIDIGDTDRLKELAYHCFLCGKCTEVCPINIDGREIILNLRREIASENSSEVEKNYRSTVREKKNYIYRNWKHATEGCVFFPGCNFPSLYPKTTDKLVKLFAEHGIGTVYDCCGKPIAELGLRNDEDEIISELKKRIDEYGIKEIVLACPNCRAHFADRLGIKITSVYTKLQELGIGAKINDNACFFVPCPDREYRIWIEELKGFIKGDISYIDGVQCCGLGGNAAKLEPEISKSFAQKMLDSNQAKAFTYCASCAGSLTRNGCPSVEHVITAILESSEGPDTKKSYLNRMMTKIK